MGLKRKETVAGTENAGVGAAEPVAAAVAAAVAEPVVQTAAAATAAAVENNTKPAAPEAVQGEPAATETAVAVKPQAAAPAVARPSMAIAGLVFEDNKDKFVAPFGTLPRLKASNGNVMDDKDRLLGDFIDVQIVSWNHIYVVGPCDNKAPSELVRYSYDNQTFDDGTGDTVADYLAELKGEWPQAASKKYGEVVALLNQAAKPSDLIGELVQLQLSPTSLSAFEGFRLQHTFKLSQGLVSSETADQIRFGVEVISSKGNTWSKLVAQNIPKAAWSA